MTNALQQSIEEHREKLQKRGRRWVRGTEGWHTTPYGRPSANQRRKREKVNVLTAARAALDQLTDAEIRELARRWGLLSGDAS